MNVPPSQIVTGNTSHTRPENRVFYPALDGLRAIAFLMVFCQHYLSLPWGWTGVNVFFVLSGFLITGILFDTRDHPHRVRTFYMRRTLRIFPLYYGIFVLLLMLTPIFGWNWVRGWWAWPLYLGNFLRFVSWHATIGGSYAETAANAVLTSSRHGITALHLGHFWSLCVEEQFYLVWPWIVFRVHSRRALLWICSITIVCVPLLRVLLQSTAPAWMLQQELLYRMTPLQLDSLLLGGLIALLWRTMDRALLLRIGQVVAAVAALIAIVYLSRTIDLSNPQWCVEYVYPKWRLTWGMCFINIFTAAVILCCLRSTGWLARILSLGPLRWLGRISYGAYVFHDILHVPVLQLAFAMGPYSHFAYAHLKPTAALLGLAVTLVLASLSFRFFETPFLNLKERWAPARS